MWMSGSAMSTSPCGPTTVTVVPASRSASRWRRTATVTPLTYGSATSVRKATCTRLPPAQVGFDRAAKRRGAVGSDERRGRIRDGSPARNSEPAGRQRGVAVPGEARVQGARDAVRERRDLVIRQSVADGKEWHDTRRDHAALVT